MPIDHRNLKYGDPYPAVPTKTTQAIVVRVRLELVKTVRVVLVARESR